MEKGHSAVKFYRWKDEIIAAGLLMAFAFIINAGIEIKGLFMDDLYLWSCYGEQSFLEFVLPIGGSRFRFLYYLACYIQMAIIGNHITWYVPCNIIINGLIAYTVFRFGRRLSGNGLLGFFCGFLYLLSRMSYYQIAQVCGLMESLALWAALGILFCLYEYLNEDGDTKAYFWIANGLYFAVCFIHERYMVLLPLILLAFLMKKEKKAWKWMVPVVLFALVQLIRLLTIGTVSPAGTGGTNVSDTFQIKQAIKFAFSQVLYLFGVNMEGDYLSILSWESSARWVKLLVSMADCVILILVVLFFVVVIKDKKNRKRYLDNFFLFVMFIGFCIMCSSVTIRVEMRWIYVSMTAAWLLLAYMCGVIARPIVKEEENKKGSVFRFPDYHKSLACILLVLAYVILMFPVEKYYRNRYPNLYFWHTQEQYNSLAEETYEKYGDAIFGKKIYILENSYEVSEFYANTFFKTFDKERKAEGTEVIFVDSIRDFGQVRDNMLILREDPEHHAYQDITEFVRELKCESIYGYYRDGWMDESAMIRVMAGKTGEIDLQFLYPGEMKGYEKSTICVNGYPTSSVKIDENIVYTTLEVEPYETVELTFENNFYLKDAQEQRGEKRFSMMVNITAD